MIELDGSFGEGGGALVRTALALAALTGKEFSVNKIRAGRKKPGLKAQHLHAIKALKEMCQAETNEFSLGSEELTFKPKQVRRGIYNVDIGTAGSISLLLQALVLPSMFAPGKVTLIVKGGTCGKWQASVDYIQNILFPHLIRFVEKIELKVLKRGYFPRGGGEVRVEITPRFKGSFDEIDEELQLKTANIQLIEQGKLEQIRGVVNLSADLQEKEVGERIKKAVEGSLRDFNQPVSVRIEYSKTYSIGGEVVLWAVFSQDGKVDFDNPVILGSDALIEKGKSSEEIGKEAARKLREIVQLNFPVDSHLEDQLIPFMGLLPGSAIIANKVTDHTRTNMYVVEKFLDVGFSVVGNRISVERK